MIKDFKEVIHLYYGAPCMFGIKVPGQETEFEKFTINIRVLHAVLNDLGEVKPILRKLGSMSVEEWKKCFELARGSVDQDIADKIKIISSSDILVKLGKGQFLFGFHRCPGNDVRIGEGISFYMDMYLIKDELSVSETGIEIGESHFNDRKSMQVQNINHIFLYLLSKHFDLFSLIDNNLAVSKE